MNTWDDFVHAVVTHAAGQIKYWEIWNEPNDPSFYCGDIPTMVTMARHAAEIIKSIDPSASVLSPSVVAGSGPAWLASFLSQGGNAAVDIIAFHGYSSAKGEDIVEVAKAYRDVMQAQGAGAKPLWDTEGSWAGSGNIGTPSSQQQMSFIAKSYILHWSAGVARIIWYAYDGGSAWGGLWNSSSGATPAAAAYGEIYRWIVGASLATACSVDQTATWRCGLTRSGGDTAEVVWNSRGTVSGTIPARFVNYRDLAGIVHPITSGPIAIGDQPILLESSDIP
jgi:hypothetical protein